MTSGAAAAVSESLQIPQSTENWLLRLPLADPSAAELRAGSFSVRGPVRAFLDGFLFDRDDMARSFELTRSASDADLVAATEIQR